MDMVEDMKSSSAILTDISGPSYYSLEGPVKFSLEESLGIVMFGSFLDGFHNLS